MSDALIRSARDRFLATFEPALCRFIILPEQGKGIGAAVLRQIFADADSQRISIRLDALRGSEANRFYQRHGFERTHEAEWDIYYVRQPSPIEQ
ncbi:MULTISPECIES: GNAT family N-acetyltransferase [Bradyrhizobium]|uniref:GNAT family N-acetyltransferase n=1 Tax=Bradyrhizobium TaxID=374 RepID=UPI0003FAF65F|nr:MULTISPECIES: GNAT family N-acetyltransferase [Bradyrhizobium]UFW53393.1 GNAT family N-acetyltransferase [Bradyrhizobium arachidis]